MEYNNKEYIQDIAFNYTCDRMVISTTSKPQQEKSDFDVAFLFLSMRPSSAQPVVH